MSLPTLKLTQGLTSFDLNNHVRFFLWQDFIPPAVSVTPLLASGTSANRSGAVKVDTRPQNRSFTFHVRMVGGSTAEMRAWVSKLQGFLNGAGNDQLPMYLVYKPDSNTPEPLWGQHGATLHYEIVHGEVRNMADYMKGNRIASDLDLEFNLILKPFALGKQQRVASATGRLHDDLLGITDGVSRGLVLGRGHTNKCTNPVFGHSTWNTGWTADASLTATKNIYREFLAPGATASALLTARATGQEFYQSINVGNTQMHTFLALVQRPDFGAVTSDDAVLFYNAALTTTFTDLGNGLYALTATAAGINASTNTGIQVKNGRSVYLLYYGAVDTDDGWFYPFWGDNLGCAWSGTAHNSTSTSTAGRVRLPVAGDTVSIAQGTIRMVCRIPQSTTFVNPVFFSFGAASLRASLTLSTMTLTLTDNTNTATSAGSITSVGATVILHFVWGAGGLKIYLNGVEVATQATFTLPAAPTYLYLGTSDSPDAQCENPIHDFSTWAEALTAAQISADADALNDLTDDRLRIAPVPWLWTKDGDDVVDNCDDSTRDNWCVVGGVPGSEAAETTWQIETSATKAGYWLMRSAFSSIEFRQPNGGTEAGQFYGEAQGTANASSSGGEYESKIVSTVEPDLIEIAITNPNIAAGKTHYFIRLKDSAGSRSVLFVPWFQNASGQRIFAYSNIRTATIDTNFRWFYIGSIFPVVPSNPDVTKQLTVGLQISVASGSFTAHVDYMMALNGTALNLIPIASASNYMLVGEKESYFLNSSGGVVSYLPTIGEHASAIPEAYNVVWFVSAGQGETHTITDTATFTRVKLTPRYTLL